MECGGVEDADESKVPASPAICASICNVDGYCEDPGYEDDERLNCVYEVFRLGLRVKL